MSITLEGVQFLLENRLQNSKTWYEEHKADYRRLVVEPMAELVTLLTPTMQSIDPGFVCEPKIGKTLSRVYRDTRFSNDKSLFRDVAWCVFKRNKQLCPGYPGYFFEFSPSGFRYGCGYYEADPKTMASMRSLILNGDPAFTAAKKAYEAQSVFALEDERYKKSKFPDLPEELRVWLDQKSICLIRGSQDAELLFSDGLWRKLAADFNLIAPIYRFLLKAEENK